MLRQEHLARNPDYQHAAKKIVLEARQHVHASDTCSVNARMAMKMDTRAYLQSAF
jgi:hypothetical protein